MEVGRKKVNQAGLSDKITFEWQDCMELKFQENPESITSSWKVDDSGAYNCLPASIREFLQNKAMADILHKNGYKNVSFKKFTFGICSMYLACK